MQSIFNSTYIYINTGADKLSEQEIRNAIYPGKFLKNIKEYANKSEFKKFIENDTQMRKRQNYIDLFLRFVAYRICCLNNFEFADFNFTTSKKNTLNNICSLYNTKDEKEYIDIIKDVDKAIKKLSSFSATSLYGKKRNEDSISNRVHAVFAEALVLAVIKNNFVIKITPQQFDEFKLKFWDTLDFEKLFVQQTTAKDNILKRIDLLMDVINNAYNR